MDRYTVICHRCGKSTFVDLSRTVSDQRCRACQGFLQGVDVGNEAERRAAGRRKLVVKVAGGAGREPEWHDQDEPIVPVRSLWPRFFRILIWGGLTALAGVILFTAIENWRKNQGSKESRLGVQDEPPPPDVRTTELWRDKATETVRRALAAKDVAQLLPFLYHPEVSADVIRRYYNTHEKLPLGADLIEDYFLPPHTGRENTVAFNFTDSAKRMRGLALVEKPDGMKIDWPSLVGLGEMSLADYLRTVPAGAVVMRVRARIGDYYNNYFSDPKRWLSIRLTDVTEDTVVHGYYELQRPGLERLTRLLPNPARDDNRPDYPVILILKHAPGNLQSDQTEIVGIVATTWYLEEGLQPHIAQARKLEDYLKETTPEKPAPPAPEKKDAPPAPPAPPAPEAPAVPPP